MMGAGQNSAVVRRRALAVARVLGFSPSTFIGRERQALHIMSHLMGMMVYTAQYQRKAYADEVLQNANKIMPRDQPQSAQFFSKLSEIVILMQEFPAHHTVITKGGPELVDDYLSLKIITAGMDTIGMGGLLGITRDLAKGGLAGVQGGRGAGRLTGGMRGALGGAKSAATGGLTRGLGVFWVVGSVTNVALRNRMIQVGNEIIRRYQDGKIDEVLYVKAFGDEGALPERFVGPGHGR